MSATIVTGSALGLLIAALYGYLGLQQARRSTSIGLAPAAFSIFWYGIAIHAAVESIWAMWVLWSAPPLDISVLVLMIKIATGVAAIAGLVVYMLLVYMGNVRVVVGAVLAYSSLLSFMSWEYLSRVPIGAELRTWTAGLTYERPEGAAHYAVAVFLFVPPLLATAWYLRLLAVTRDPLQRRRIMTTGACFVVFFAGFLLGWVHERWFWWGLIERLLALVAAGGVLWTSLPSFQRASAPSAS